MKTVRDNALIIFARSPKLGKVKTRLSESLGDNFALKFYKLCAEHVFNECKKLNAKNSSVYLFYTGKGDEELIKKWAGTPFIFSLQTGTNLGQRMEDAFYKVFAGGANKVLIIGTDVPDIELSLIEDALYFLDTNDVVIGPSMDGGYYLLGMKKLYKDLLKKIPWSTNFVFEETVNKIKSKKLKYKVMTKLYDIDTEEDLRKWLSADNLLKSNSIKNKIFKELPNYK